MQCPLCFDSNTIFYHQDNKRTYFQCQCCKLVFVSPEFLPSTGAEKSEYDKHENSFEDDGYRTFLSKLLTPLSIYIKPSSSALDFGCGPAPVLAELLKEKGLEVSIYDPFYADNIEVLEQSFDVITCTEAIEHFHQPAKEWFLFNSMLKPNGILAIMTKRVLSKERFKQWHYKNDPTHVSFFSEATFNYLAHRDTFSIEFPSSDVVLMKKL